MVRLEQGTFDRAIERLRHSRTHQAHQMVLDYIRAMPTLYFVQCGQRSNLVPWIIFDEDTPVAMVFTDENRAVLAANACLGEDNQTRVVGLPTNAASLYITALAAQGVERVCFNHGPLRFDVPIDEVILATTKLRR